MHGPLELLAQVVGRQLIAAEDCTEARAGEHRTTGPGQAQTAFVMARIRHQIGGHRAATQPGGDHGDHITDHHDQIDLIGLAQQADQAPQQIEDLALDQFGQPSPQAGVTEAAGAEFMAVAKQRNAGLLIGPTQAGQRQGLDVMAQGLKVLSQQ